MCAEDIEVTIHAGGLALYESEDGEKNRLDWSSEALGKDLVAGPTLTVPCKKKGVTKHCTPNVQQAVDDVHTV